MKKRVILSDISENKANPRTLKGENFTRLKHSLAQFQQMLNIRGIAVFKTETGYTIAGGNQRYRALLDLKKEISEPSFISKYSLSEESFILLQDFMKNGIPIEDCTGMSDQQIQRFIITDNVQFGDWDFDALANTFDVEDLIDWGVQIGDLSNFSNLVSGEATEDDYEIPEEIKTDIRHGDVFEIGPHRLMCGDSTNEDEVYALMNGNIADMYITDPPYGVSYHGKTKKALTIKNDALSPDKTFDLFKKALSNAEKVCKKGAAVYATVPAGQLQYGFMKVMVDNNTLRQSMVWDKCQFVLGHSDYHYEHEPILYGWFQGGNHYFINDRTKSTILRFKRPQINEHHPTMKPVELWAEMIKNSSKQSEICYDSFLGSGTTMVASHQLGRICFGMELDPKYCQVILNRMINLDDSLPVKKNGEKYNNSQITVENET